MNGTSCRYDRCALVAPSNPYGSIQFRGEFRCTACVLQFFLFYVVDSTDYLVAYHFFCLSLSVVCFGRSFS